MESGDNVINPRKQWRDVPGSQLCTEVHQTSPYQMSSSEILSEVVWMCNKIVIIFLKFYKVNQERRKKEWKKNIPGSSK